MGILSSTASIVRYRVSGKVDPPVNPFVEKGLVENTISDADEGAAAKRVGWTSFQAPFQPDFSGSNFSLGAYFIFSLRIDRKVLPQKVIQKHVSIETAKRLKKSGREFLSANEKKMIKDHVINLLNLRIPSTPHLHDVIWDHQDQTVWFFSTIKSANEDLETLFFKSFKLSLIRLFPYTVADLAVGLSDGQKDVLSKISPTVFGG
ncbi:MAG: exonuclease [Desulfobacteraceae bacterium]|nr:MAG: exonuclease [Desulfobacteraceae bacterium]